MVFYTYLWLREDGTPYYAGKGHGNRAFVVHRCGKLYPPHNSENILIQEWPDEAGALEGEKLLILIYGRKDLGTGVLRNMTDGGDGLANPSEATRRKMGAFNRSRIWTDKQRQDVAIRSTGKQYMLGCSRTPETKEKIRIAQTGRKISPASRLKMSVSASQRHARDRAANAIHS